MIGGRSGSGKTLVLRELQQMDQQVLDLELVANHRGSAFGAVKKQQNPLQNVHLQGHFNQPTNAQFANDLAFLWESYDPDRPVFIEDEGPNVGAVQVPPEL